MVDKFEQFARNVAEFTTSPAGEVLVTSDPAMVLKMFIEQSKALFPAPPKKPAKKQHTSFKPSAWLKRVDIAPTMPHKAGRPKCYEQMHKTRFEWWTTTMTGDVVVDSGPYPTEAAALRAIAASAK